MEKQELENKTLDVLRKISKHIDFKTLQEQGLLVKEGAWYRVRNIHELSDQVTLQISEMESDPRKGLRVKFVTDAQRKKAAKSLAKVERAMGRD